MSDEDQIDENTENLDKHPVAVAENQAAGLSANSAYNAAKREVMETLKKIKVTKKAEGGEIVFGKNVDKDLL